MVKNNSIEPALEYYPLLNCTRPKKVAILIEPAGSIQDFTVYNLPAFLFYIKKEIDIGTGHGTRYVLLLAITYSVLVLSVTGRTGSKGCMDKSILQHFLYKTLCKKKLCANSQHFFNYFPNYFAFLRFHMEQQPCLDTSGHEPICLYVLVLSRH